MQILLVDNRNRREFIRFFVVGVLNTGFSYGIYAVGIFLGQTYIVASLVSIVAGILFSFKTQGSFVFNNASNRLFFLFVANWIAIYLLMIGSIAVFIRFGANEYWAGILSLPLLVVVSYLTQKFIVFRKPSQELKPDE